MSVVTQRGILLLPVALTLALVATLAYTMTREGSMSAAEVDAAYDIEVAHYLAATGVHLARWQNEKRGCGLPQGFSGVTFPGGKIDAAVAADGKSAMKISVKSDTGRTTRSLPNVPVTRYDRYEAPLTIIPTDDTSIVKGVFTSRANDDRLETTDGNAHALLKFSLSDDNRKDLDKALLISAQLKLVQASSNTRTLSLGVHRVTKSWGDNALWTTPWTTPGGDYAPVATSIVPLDGSTFLPVEYSWRIDSLLELWLADKNEIQSVLLKPVGPLDAKFYSLNSFLPLLRPRLVVRYYPRCT